MSCENNIVVKSPMDGKVIDISEVSDEVFAKKLVGDGVAVKIKTGEIVSPVNGTVKLILQNKHGIGIETIEGVDILLHINTENFQDNIKHFHPVVKEGDSVKIGDDILKIDEKILEKEELVACVVVSNMSMVKGIEKSIDGDVSKEDTIFKIVI
ncbi:PTS sugar transporter subunit IIA [Clostridium felsineum]|uniref:PTS sugar transporter subunit IIA n=1 Tax=Clostridium felsineum TaxID=36839 RepID=UPI00098C497C|nr:PTS glucose transporter subunit IIA [Clostridium felsineum]URZ17877.1 PTS system glucoside-specific EIICBA component [Clostridium felsineum DSM 794]